MAKRVVRGKITECVRGDIANQPAMDAVVNAANAELRMGGGVAGALHSAAGPGLEMECRPLAPIRPGEAVITGAHNLPNHHVIHCLGPILGRDKPVDALLASCYRNALHLAEKEGVVSIAFPAISTGAFGVPMEPAAWVALRTILEELPGLSSVAHVRMVLYDFKALEIHEKVLDELVREHLVTRHPA